jgi:hypothetical protein
MGKTGAGTRIWLSEGPGARRTEGRRHIESARHRALRIGIVISLNFE